MHMHTSKNSFLSAFTHLDCFLSHFLTFWNVPVEKRRFIMQRVRLQPQDSEKGFWAWGSVTINLVKSTDESLSHPYNQRHFRPLFPQRNSCFLWHILKFYFKNSQHLKADCCMLPRPSLTMCFQFSQSYYHVTGSDVSCCPHQICTQV